MKHLLILNGWSEGVNRRDANKTMAKRKQKQVMIQKHHTESERFIKCSLRTDPCYSKRLAYGIWTQYTNIVYALFYEIEMFDDGDGNPRCACYWFWRILYNQYLSCISEQTSFCYINVSRQKEMSWKFTEKKPNNKSWPADTDNCIVKSTNIYSILVAPLFTLAIVIVETLISHSFMFCIINAKSLKCILLM